ncbi:hypothetical protein [Roseibium sp.]|uniref:hypothetical protein n=1 Tax=Roseibium sp. TaxID=1936156 RepID=UPI003A97D7F7
MRYVIGLLVALSIASTPFAWHWASQHFAPPAVPVADTSGLETEMNALREELTRLQSRVDGLDIRMSLGLSRQTEEPEAPKENPAASDSLKDSFAQVVLIADRRSVNEGLTVASPSFLRDLIGLPREGLTDDCQSATNPKLKGLLQTEDVGPIKARMLEPALVSIRQVFVGGFK